LVSFEPAGAHSFGDRFRCATMAWRVARASRA
jgi:hypothetical protein